MCTCVLSCVRLFVTPWTVDHQALLSMGFSTQEYWTGLPCPPPGDLPNPEIEPMSLISLALAGKFFTTSTIIIYQHTNVPFLASKTLDIFGANKHTFLFFFLQLFCVMVVKQMSTKDKLEMKKYMGV